MVRLSEHDKLRLMHTAWRALSNDEHSIRMFKRGLVRIHLNYGDGSVMWISTKKGWNALENYLDKRSEPVLMSNRIP